MTSNRTNASVHPFVTSIRANLKEDALRARQRWERARRMAPSVEALLRRLLTLPSFSDVQRVSSDPMWSGDPEDERTPLGTLSLSLAPDKAATLLLREIVRVGITPKIQKRPHYSGEGLVAEFTYDRLVVIIYGYKPETCRVVTEEIRVLATDVTIGTDGRPYTTRTQSRVICGDEEDVQT